MKKVHHTMIITHTQKKNKNKTKQNKKTKCSYMEIGISRVYNVLIVLERTVNQFYVASIYNYNIISFKILGTLRSTTETATKTSLQSVTLHHDPKGLFT